MERCSAISMTQQRRNEVDRFWTLADTGRMMLALGYIVGAIFNLLYTARKPEVFEQWVESPLLPGYRWFFVDVVADSPRIWLPLAATGELLLGVLLLSRGRVVRLGLLASMLFQLLLAPMWVGQSLMNLLLALLHIPLLRRRYPVSIPALLR